MPLPEMSYARLGATAPEPDHERNDPMTHDDWKLDTPPEPLDDEEQARIDAAEDLYWEQLADDTGGRY